MPIKDFDPDNLTSVYDDVQVVENDVQTLDNNSGAGPESPVLDIVSKRFCWGAFFLNWIWGLGNKTYITLLILLIASIPFVGIVAMLGCQIWFGIKGNKWAWQNKRWKSIEHFHSVQKNWAITGLILFILNLSILVLVLFFMFFPTLSADSLLNEYYMVDNKQKIEKSISTLREISALNRALKIKTLLTSDDLAKLFAEMANVESYSGDTVQTKDGITWKFQSDGLCSELGDCFVVVSDRYGLYEEIPITQKNGFIKVHDKDVLAKYKE